MGFATALPVLRALLVQPHNAVVILPMNGSTMDDVAYKILSTGEFATLQSGHFDGAPIDIADGYIHLSAALQVPGTVEKHFGGRTDLIIAAIDLKSLGKKIRWEVARDNALFPHLYGRLEAAHVIAAEPLVRLPDGSVALP